MKALVLVKEVAKLSDQFEISENAIDERYREYDLNEWDDFAVEEAVQAEEEDIVEEVVVATIGPERSEETIRKALAKGADRAIRIWDDSLEEVDFLDIGAKTAMFSAIVETEQPDLVFAGVQADDDMFGATGVALAEDVDYAWAAVVNELEIDEDAGLARVHRELEGGMIERTEVDIPAVVTVQTGINQPRYASLRGIRMAQQKEIEHRSLSDIGLDPSILESPIRLTDMREPQAEGETELFEGSANETGSQLAALLRDKGVGNA